MCRLRKEAIEPYYMEMRSLISKIQRYQHSFVKLKNNHFVYCSAPGKLILRFLPNSCKVLSRNLFCQNWQRNLFIASSFLIKH